MRTEVVFLLANLALSAAFTSPAAIASRFRSAASPHSLSAHSARIRHSRGLVSLSLEGGAGGGSGGASSGGGGGGGDGGDGEEEAGGNWRVLLAKAGREAQSIPNDVLSALNDGRANAEVLERYLSLDSVAFMKPWLAMKFFRDRLLADNTFLNKVGIEVALGGFMQLVAEYQNRKQDFLKEIDFVAAGMMTCMFANFFSVYLAAPTLIPKLQVISSNPMSQFFRSCPDNAFQTILKGVKPPSILQRVGGAIKPMPQLFTVGFVAAAAGYALTTVSMVIRKAIAGNKAKVPGEKGRITALQIAKISTAVGVYVAISSNLRYQFLAGVLEQRVLDVVLKQQIGLRTAGSACLRTGNTYLGSYLIVVYLKCLGLQETGGTSEAPPPVHAHPKRAPKNWWQLNK